MASHHGFADVAHQTWMVLDRARLDAYARALAQTVTADDVVLDIGTGSGVLALLAAKAGARRVIAIERTGMVQTAREHIVENGLEGVVEVVRADLLELTSLDEALSSAPSAPDAEGLRPTLIIGENFGTFAPDEGVHHLYAKALSLAAPGARCLPRRYALQLAPVHPAAMHEELAWLDDVHGVSLKAMAARLRRRKTTARVTAEDRRGPWTTGPWLDLAAPLPEVFSAELPIEQSGPVSAIAAGFVAELCDGVTLDTTLDEAPTHWGQAVFAFDPPLDVAAGDTLSFSVRPRLVNQSRTYRWRVEHGVAHRTVDGLEALSGDQDDLAAFFGLTARAPEHDLGAGQLAEWATALGGALPGSLDEMVERLQEAYPERFPDASAARQAALGLVYAAWRRPLT